MNSAESYYEHHLDAWQLFKDFLLYLFLLYWVNQEVCIRLSDHHIWNLNEVVMLSMISQVGLSLGLGIANLYGDNPVMISREVQRRVTALLWVAWIWAIEMCGVENIPDMADLPATCIWWLIWYYSGRK
jgi:hypothetical protein